MRLLAVILHREDILDDVLSILVEHELTDPVVIESRSGLEVLERDLPIFAGLRSLMPGGIDFSRLVLTAIEDESLADHVLREITALGSADRSPGSAHNSVLLMPLDRFERF